MVLGVVAKLQKLLLEAKLFRKLLVCVCIVVALLGWLLPSHQLDCNRTILSPITGVLLAT